MNDVSTHHNVELLGRYSKTHPLPTIRTSGSRVTQTAKRQVHAVRKRLKRNAIEQLVADYEAGHSTIELMRIYGISKGAVLNLLEQHEVNMRGQGVRAERLQEAIELYSSGLSLKTVAAQLDCSAETLRQALLRAGVTLRARWERGTQ
jgi:DNA-binding CsgD family transcriptional regulator